MVTDIEQLEWKCSCEETRPPTAGNYMSLIRGAAHKGHKVQLVNKATGEIVATSLKDAERKGITLVKEVAPPGKPVLTPDGMVDYTLTLPPEAFTFFNMAKNFGLIKDDELTFDEWVYECIGRRFAADYGMEVVLQPLKGKRDKDMKATIREIVKEILAETEGK